MEATSGKRCKTCNNCKQVYRQGCWGYYSSKWYYCAAREQMTEPERVCGQWSKKEIVCDFSAQRFDEVEWDIKELMKYFENK